MRITQEKKNEFIVKIENKCKIYNYSYLDGRENYKNTTTKIKLKCNVHNFIWKTTPNNFIYGNCKCPMCSKSILNNDIIDERLKNTNIKRIGNYTGPNYKKIEWECLIDGFRWFSSAKCIMLQKDKSKCPHCKKITNEVIDERLKNRNIKRIGNIIGGTHSKIEFECNIDKYRWTANLNSVFNGRGCPKCAGRARVTDEIIDERIKNRSIERIGSINGKSVSDKIKWQCKKCNNIWEATISKITNDISGCPKCRYKKENELGEMLLDMKLSFIHNKTIYINSRKYIIVDFFIENKNTIIEYNGKQHYSPVEFFGGKKFYIKQCKRDNILRKYCQKHNINLIEIPYYIKQSTWKNIIINNIGDINV